MEEIRHHLWCMKPYEKKTLIFWYSLCQTGEFTGFLNYPTVPWHQFGRTLPGRCAPTCHVKGWRWGLQLGLEQLRTLCGSTVGGGWVQRWSDGGSVEVGVRCRVTKTGPVVRGGFDPKKTQWRSVLSAFFLRDFGVNTPFFNEDLKSPRQTFGITASGSVKIISFGFWQQKSEKNRTIASRKRTYKPSFLVYIWCKHMTLPVWSNCTIIQYLWLRFTHQKIPYRDPLVKI